MLLFTVTGSARGARVIDGKFLTLEGARRALGALERYENIIELSINITSQQCEEGPRSSCKILAYDDFVAGKRTLSDYDLVDLQALKDMGLEESEEAKYWLRLRR